MRFNRLEDYISLLSFLMCCPVFLIGGINASMFIFIIVLLRQKLKILFVPSLISYSIFLFGISAIVSTLFTDTQSGATFSSAMRVLPNYIYWTIMVLTLVDLGNRINFQLMTKAVCLGIACLTIYFVIQADIKVLNLPFINSITLNNFAFLLICYVPPSLVYLRHSIDSRRLTLFVFTIVVSLLILKGRRAGTVLVLIPSIAALVVSKLDWRNFYRILALVCVSAAILNTSLVKKSISTSNSRIYDLVYESSDLLSTDRSYLVRRLQVEKALIIFDKHPITGIGLNNWVNYKVNFEGDFEGSEYVLYKTNMDKKSAHNSYISILAEGGLLLFGSLLVLFILNMVEFVRKYNVRNIYENAFYWSFIGMMVHLYFISAILNVYCWFLIGIVSSVSVKYSCHRGRNFQ